MSFKEETKGINAVMILEAIGKPPEHLTEALEKLIGEMEKENGVRIIEKKINEPILNELTRRLHGYDEVARVIQIEKNILEKKLREILSKNGK